MHQTILTQRQLSARQKIVERLTALVHHLELDPALIETLQPAGIRDHAVRDMIQLEAVAQVLDAIAENAGAPAAPVTAVTVNEFIAPRETYAGPEGGPVQEIERPAELVEAETDQAEEPEAIPPAPAKSSRSSRTTKSSKKK